MQGYSDPRNLDGSFDEVRLVSEKTLPTDSIDLTEQIKDVFKHFGIVGVKYSCWEEHCELIMSVDKAKLISAADMIIFIDKLLCSKVRVASEMESLKCAVLMASLTKLKKSLLTSLELMLDPKNAVDPSERKRYFPRFQPRNKR